MKKSKEVEKKKEWEILSLRIDELKLPDQDKAKLKKEYIHKDLEKSRLMYKINNYS